MIVFLLLVIIAILLLGSSVFLGIVGAILGIVVAIAAVFLGLYAVASTLAVPLDEMVMYGCFALLGIAIAGRAMGLHQKPK